MKPWSIITAGEYRREDHDDGTTHIWLAGWHFTDDNGQSAVMATPDDETSAHLIIPTANADTHQLLGHSLKELEGQAAQ